MLNPAIVLLVMNLLLGNFFILIAMWLNKIFADEIESKNKAKFLVFD